MSFVSVCAAFLRHNLYETMRINHAEDRVAFGVVTEILFIWAISWAIRGFCSIQYVFCLSLEGCGYCIFFILYGVDTLFFSSVLFIYSEK